MHGSRLVVALLVLAACKESQPSSTTATSSAAIVPRAVPSSKIYAASAHVRVVDPSAGVVVGRMDLQKAITGFAFTADGKRGFVASSAGVQEFDVASDKWIGRVTDHPSRRVWIEDGRLYSLEHDVVVQPNGTREILPFRLVAIELASGKIVADEEIGQQIQFVLPASASAARPNHVVIGDGGTIRVGTGKLSEGAALALKEQLGGDGPFRVRGEAAYVNGTHVYVPVESARARILDLDLASGRTSWIDLERPLQMRTLAVARGMLYVNASNELIVVDLATRSPRVALELPGAHIGLALSSDGTWAFLAQTIHEGGGAVTTVDLEKLAVVSQTHLEDISPWAIGILPR